LDFASATKEAGPQAESPQSEQPQSSLPASGGWISSGKELGPWWLMRSTKYDPMPPQWLYHLELSYEYTRNRGNFVQDVHEGTARLIFRKSRFTPSLAYSLEKRDMTLGDVQIEYKKDLVVLDVTADLPMRLFTSAGLMWNQDETVFVDSQYLYYGGVGFYLLDIPQLRVSGGYAYSDLKSMFGAGTHKTDRFYLQELFFIPITPLVTLVQDLLYHRALDSSSDYFWELRIPVIFKIADHVSLVPVYKLKHDELYRPAFIRNMPREIEDTTISIELQVTF
jgi:hypothetical protein